MYIFSVQTNKNIIKIYLLPMSKNSGLSIVIYLKMDEVLLSLYQIYIIFFPRSQLKQLPFPQRLIEFDQQALDGNDNRIAIHSLKRLFGKDFFSTVAIAAKNFFFFFLRAEFGLNTSLEQISLVSKCTTFYDTSGDR